MKTASKIRGLQPATRDALKLLTEGSVAMARVEDAGLRIDVRYLDSAIEAVRKQIADMHKAIRESKEYRVWSKHYGNRMKIGSRVQLGRVIFDILGHKRNPYLEGSAKKSRSGKLSNDAVAFKHLKLPFTTWYFDVTKMEKALSTYLLGIRREVCDGYIHPFINLHTAESYRSSENCPNFQNLPIRNKGIAKIVRACIIPRPGNVLLEVDYSTQEVRVAYCYNLDPKLKYDILTGDMHRDRAKELFLLTDEELGPTGSGGCGKPARQESKNKFVFAEFYGDYYANCAPKLWESIEEANLRRSDGVSFYEHLKEKGITELGPCKPELEPRKGTFEYHVREVENRMWNECYTVYTQWKKDWWGTYLCQGGINTLTGFRQEGIFRRNQILCDSIQGSAFHCLLWSLIQLLKEMVKKRMKSKVINQVHDSMWIDAVPDEVPELIAMIRRIALGDVAQHYKWIVVPLDLEFEYATDNMSNKKPLVGDKLS